MQFVMKHILEGGVFLLAHIIDHKIDICKAILLAQGQIQDLNPGLMTSWTLAHHTILLSYYKIKFYTTKKETLK